MSDTYKFLGTLAMASDGRMRLEEPGRLYTADATYGFRRQEVYTKTEGPDLFDWRMRLAVIAAECPDPDTQAALDKLLEDTP